MITVQFKAGEKVIKTKQGFTHDTGQQITILGLLNLPANPLVSFYVDDLEESRIGTYIEGVLVCDIPNIMVTHDVFGAAVKVVSDTSTITKYAVVITQTRIGKPSGAVSVDEQTSFDQLVAILSGLIADVEELEAGIGDIPFASETVLGGIMVGDNLIMTDGVLSIDTEALTDYVDTVILGGAS